MCEELSAFREQLPVTQPQSSFPAFISSLWWFALPILLIKIHRDACPTLSHVCPMAKACGFVLSLSRPDSLSPPCAGMNSIRKRKERVRKLKKLRKREKQLLKVDSTAILNVGFPSFDWLNKSLFPQSRRNIFTIPYRATSNEIPFQDHVYL